MSHQNQWHGITNSDLLFNIKCFKTKEKYSIIEQTLINTGLNIFFLLCKWILVITTNNCWKSINIIYIIFDNSHFNRCEVVSHCSFNLHFFFMSKVEFLFMYLRTILFLRLRSSITHRLWVGFELMGSYPLLADNFFLFELFLWTFVSYSNAKIRLLWCELQRFICLLTESSMQKFSLI